MILLGDTVLSYDSRVIIGRCFLIKNKVPIMIIPNILFSQNNSLTALSDSEKNKG
ncbi:MAG UNVERIFIED_CONTAM: hypothetical protein LVQ98_01860 [Rickettsiaceae bacterium]